MFYLSSVYIKKIRTIPNAIRAGAAPAAEDHSAEGGMRPHPPPHGTAPVRPPSGRLCRSLLPLRERSSEPCILRTVDVSACRALSFLAADGARHASIDLLDDLDLDYLNVNDFDNLDGNVLSANSENVAISSNGP